MIPSVCIEMLFTDRPWPDRLSAVRDAGGEGYEFWSFRGKPVDDLARTAEALGLRCTALCADTGTTYQHGLVHAPDPSRIEPAVVESCAIAKKLGALTLIVTTGLADATLDRALQHDNVVRHLQIAGRVAAEHGMTIVLEPLNALIDHPGYYLTQSSEAFRIIEEVGLASVRLLFDIYHQQVTEGNLTANLTSHTPLIGHLHVADVPGRHEPGSGEIHYANLLAAVSRAGYWGAIALEAKPRGDHAAAVADFVRLIQAARAAHAPQP